MGRWLFAFFYLFLLHLQSYIFVLFFTRYSSLGKDGLKSFMSGLVGYGVFFCLGVFNDCEVLASYLGRRSQYFSAIFLVLGFWGDIRKKGELLELYLYNYDGIGLWNWGTRERENLAYSWVVVTFVFSRYPIFTLMWKPDGDTCFEGGTYLFACI